MAKATVQLPELQELSEQIGEFIHYWGFKRVHGRIWTQLFLSDKPLDSADLVRQMKISKALVSISMRELLEYEVVIEAGKSDRGTNLYSVNPDILKVILNVLRGRERRLLSRVEAAYEGLDRIPDAEKIANEVSPARLQKLRQIVGDASKALDGVISLRAVDFAQWKEVFSLNDVVGCAVGAGSSSARALSQQDISSARSDGEIQLIGRPLLAKS